MAEVYGSNEAVVRAYVNRSSERGRSGNGNLYFEGDTLFSYGSHFPLAVRQPSGMYIVNGDKYSVTTSAHQSLVFQAIPNSRRLEMPFSALNAAFDGRTGIWRRSTYDAIRMARDLRVIDWTDDKWVDTGRVSKKTGEPIIEHVLGGVLFEYEKEFYVSGIDSTGLARLRMFFLTKLAPSQVRKYGKPKTVGEALELLKPAEVKEWEAKTGEEAPRQGEWFFVPLGASNGVTDLGKVEKTYVLRNRDKKREFRHFVTEGMKVGRLQLARGVVRHGLEKEYTDWKGALVRYRDNVQHKELKLFEAGTKPKDRRWFVAYESPQAGSWTASGAVD